MAKKPARTDDSATKPASGSKKTSAAPKSVKPPASKKTGKPKEPTSAVRKPVKQKQTPEPVAEKKSTEQAAKPETVASKAKPKQKAAAVAEKKSAKQAAKSGKSPAKAKPETTTGTTTKTTTETASPTNPKTSAKPVAEEQSVAEPQVATGKTTEISSPLAFLSSIKATELHFEKGAALYTAGEDCTRAYFVKKGGFSAEIPNESGGGIVLYHVGTGEICVLSVAAATARGKHRVTAVLTESTDILAVPAEQLAALLESDAEARIAVYSQMTQRLTETLTMLEEVAFRRKDIRLATVLSRKITWENLAWPGTIGELAESTGTSVAVAALILQEFQRLGILVVEQGAITVTDRAALIKKSME